MSTRPERRRSSLSGSNPIAPVPAAAPAPTSAPAPEPTQAVAAPASAAPLDETPAAAAKPRSKYPPKVSFYQEREDTDRIRGAIMHTIPYEGTRTLSQFISKAVMAEVERLEAKYNDGQPFPRVGARELPQGRPMGE